MRTRTAVDSSGRRNRSDMFLTRAVRDRLSRWDSCCGSPTVVHVFLVVVTVMAVPIDCAIGPEESCQLRPVIHVLKQPGCQPKPIPSFACHGSCSSYVQVSGSRYWQVERSCMCCQEMGEREATKAVFCPKGPGPKFRKLVTRAPVECMCRPCTAPDEASVLPQEFVGL
ncbi:cuticle-tanning hormone bursicon [Rhipicephalus microplus]|uniref:cuticle-tanning hormone bursicon n=1 Tax=Rhipicephalus microplus TaxID=6941 RepID=UPI003F6B3F7A